MKVKDARVEEVLNNMEAGIAELALKTSATLTTGLDGTAARAFQLIDQNNDGQISRDEFQHRFIHYMNELGAI